MATCPFGPSELCHAFRQSSGEQNVDMGFNLGLAVLALPGLRRVR